MVNIVHNGIDEGYIGITSDTYGYLHTIMDNSELSCAMRDINVFIEVNDGYQWMFGHQLFR
jgi:GGDEF domain-containing protein